MKRSVAILLVLLCMVGLSACDKTTRGDAGLPELSELPETSALPEPPSETAEPLTEAERRDAMAEELLGQYPRVTGDRFLTCQGTEFLQRPDWSRGLISSHWADVNLDGEDELILTRNDDTDHLAVDIYSMTGQEPQLLGGAQLAMLDYCTQIDVELFYNTVLGSWCITVDSSYDGAYTGAWGYNLELYQITDGQITLAQPWEWGNMPTPEAWGENKIVSEAEVMGVNYLIHQDSPLDQRTTENDYRCLASVRCEVVSGEYPVDYTWGCVISGNLTLAP